MMSRFVDNSLGPKNHKEFYNAQVSKPVGLYARPAGQFSQAVANKTQYGSIVRSQLGS